MYSLRNLLFFDIPLLCYYINLRLSITFCLFSGDLYLSLDISLPWSFVTVSEWFCCQFFQSLVILLAISLPVTPPVASAVYYQVIYCRSFSMMKKFLAIFTTYVFTYIFTNIFTNIFSKRQKSLNWIMHNFLCFTL